MIDILIIVSVLSIYFCFIGNLIRSSLLNIRKLKRTIKKLKTKL